MQIPPFILFPPPQFLLLLISLAHFWIIFLARLKFFFLRYPIQRLLLNFQTDINIKFKQITEILDLVKFNNGHSLEKCPVPPHLKQTFSLGRLKCFLGSGQSFAKWPSFPQLRQIKGLLPYY